MILNTVPVTQSLAVLDVFTTRFFLLKRCHFQVWQCGSYVSLTCLYACLIIIHIILSVHFINYASHVLRSKQNCVFLLFCFLCCSVFPSPLLSAGDYTDFYLWDYEEQKSHWSQPISSDDNLLKKKKKRIKELAWEAFPLCPSPLYIMPPMATLFSVSTYFGELLNVYCGRLVVRFGVSFTFPHTHSSDFVRTLCLFG